MASLITNNGYYALAFTYRKIRVREYLGLQSPADRREAERRLMLLERALLSGTFDYATWFPNSPHLQKLGLASVAGISSKATLGEYAQAWLAKKEPTLKPGTYAWYRDTLKNHVLVAPLASMSLSAIRKTDIELFIAQLMQQTGPRAVNGAIQRLRSILNDALEDDLIDKNPMLKIKGIKQVRPRIDPFTLDEAETVLSAAEGWEKSLMAVLLFAGLRPGEALALQWSDIDWRRGTIDIQRTWSRFGVHSPKTTGRQEQPVEMLEGVAMALQEQRSRSQLKSRAGWVWPSDQDTPIREENFRMRNWKAILRRAGLKHRNLYQCRHSFASIMLSAKGTQWVAAALGHTSLDMVTRIYTRPNVKQSAYTVEQVEAAIRRGLGISVQARQAQ